jgi:hypothetical protein
MEGEKQGYAKAAARTIGHQGGACCTFVDVDKYWNPLKQFLNVKKY